MKNYRFQTEREREKEAKMINKIAKHRSNFKFKCSDFFVRTEFSFFFSAIVMVVWPLRNEEKKIKFKSDGWFNFSAYIFRISNLSIACVCVCVCARCADLNLFSSLARLVYWRDIALLIYGKRLNSFARLIWSSLIAHHSRHNQFNLHN